MTQRANILQELHEIGSRLLNEAPQNIYSVPVGYFEGFADQLLNRIKELNTLSPILNNISKENLFSVPAGYFDGLEERLMNIVRESEDYQTAREELESISPLLSGLNKPMPYNVPQGYFENLNPEVNNKPEIKIVSITRRRWFSYAAVAVVVSVIALGGLLFGNRKTSVDPNSNPGEWVAKNIKKVNTEDLNNFIQLTDEEKLDKENMQESIDKTSDIKELIKDVPEKEIQEFLNDASTGENNSTGLLN